MSHTGIIDVVVTEDSDLLTFGCRKVFFKMENNFGNGEEIDMRNLYKVNPNASYEKLLIACVLSGCDYLENIKGIGFKKAWRMIMAIDSDPNVKFDY